MGTVARRRLLGSALLALPWLACPGRAAEPRKLVFGDTSPVASSWPNMIAASDGLFAKSGLAVETVYTGNNVYVVQQLIGGSLDIGATTFDSALRGMASGAPVVIIGSQMLRYPYSIVAAPGIADLKGLAGKSIILPFATSPLTTLLDTTLRDKGVDPAKLDKVYDGSTPNRMKALLAHTVAAAALTQPFDMIALGQGYQRIFDYSSVTGAMGFTTYVARRDWLTKNGDTARAFLRAVGDAVKVFYDPGQRQGVIDILVHEAKIDPPVASQVYDYYANELKPFSPALAVPEQTITQGVAALGSAGAPLHGKPFAALADLSFLPG